MAAELTPANLKKAARALRRSGGNLKQAAENLKIKRAELKALVDAHPDLLDAALEAHERGLDKAEAAIRHAMHDSEPRKAMAAAVSILRTSRRWRSIRPVGEN